MKKIIMIASIALSSFAMAAGNNEVNVNVGFTAGAAALGASYEKDTNNIGWGGYFFLQTEKDDAFPNGIYQTLALGGMMKVHVIKNSNIDAYVAPGFGIAMVSDFPEQGGGEDDKTVFGPSMKIGAQYYFNPDVKLGLERFMITNWFDDEAPASAEYTTVTIGFDF